MKIESHVKSPKINVNSVEFQGLLEANYKDLVEAFGNPVEGDLYMTDVQWKLKIHPDGGKPFPVKLYNYKNGKNYLGEDGLDIEKIPIWHVATSKKVDENASKYIEHYLKELAKK